MPEHNSSSGVSPTSQLDPALYRNVLAGRGGERERDRDTARSALLTGGYRLCHNHGL